MRQGTVLLCALAAFAPCAGALEIEGVKLPETVALAKGAPPLVLNGAGVRHKLGFMKVYVGALYLPAKSANADDILRDPRAKRVAMHVLAETLTAKELIASLNNALAANHIPAELALIEGRLQELNRMMSKIGVIRRGGTVILDYLPGTGTRITVNGEERITIAGEDFYRALLRIWIGPRPVDGRLRDAMLGGGAGLRLF
jgi:hypothetical protein